MTERKKKPKPEYAIVFRLLSVSRINKNNYIKRKNNFFFSFIHTLHLRHFIRSLMSDDSIKNKK